MFALAILIGIYSYILFILGISHLLYPWSVGFVTVGWLIGVVYWYKKEISGMLAILKKINTNIQRLSPFILVCIVLLFILWSVNLIGALAPELSFDALWYHLTIPKIFVDNHKFFFIPGGLYYYSLMPKLVDMLYVPAVMAGSDTGAKLIHYGFGLLTVAGLFQLSKRFISLPLTLFVLVVFSANLVVAWESTTAYIDLGRTFFEVMAVYGLVLYLQEKKDLWLTESAVMLGFAVTTKMIAITSLPIFIILLLYVNKNNISRGVKLSIKYSAITVLIPLPYFVFSILNSGNPFYPLFTKYYTSVIEPGVFSLAKVLSEYWILFVSASDPVNPIYIIAVPFVILLVHRMRKTEKLIALYCLISLIMWYVTPRTGGGRFILPYLPVLSLLVGITLSYIHDVKIRKILIGIGLFVACTTIGYRVIVSARYVPVILGQESRSEYLTKNLNYSFGDFYDVDGYFEKTISSEDTVLVYGIHNLYYMNFRFVHESYAKRGDEFNYILAPIDMPLPERFYSWKAVYTNTTTGVSLYTQRGTRWVY